LKNYYSILGIDKNSTNAEIKKAFRKMALKFHPDINLSLDAKDIFIDIYIAYDVLIDSQKREIYDRYVENYSLINNSLTPLEILEFEKKSSTKGEELSILSYSKFRLLLLDKFINLYDTIKFILKAIILVLFIYSAIYSICN